MCQDDSIIVPNFVRPIRVFGSVHLDPAIARACRKVSAEALHSTLVANLWIVRWLIESAGLWSIPALDTQSASHRGELQHGTPWK